MVTVETAQQICDRLAVSASPQASILATFLPYECHCDPECVVFVLRAPHVQRSARIVKLETANRTAESPTHVEEKFDWYALYAGGPFVRGVTSFHGLSMITRCCSCLSATFSDARNQLRLYDRLSSLA